jgi:HSP20 family molecular chaperone IbpA
MSLNPLHGLERLNPFGDSTNNPFFRELADLFHLHRGFEVKEENGKFHMTLDLPGVKASDVKVEMEGGGCGCSGDCGCKNCQCSSCRCQGSATLHIHGVRKTTKDDTISETKFDRRFTVGSNVDVENLTASLYNGVLVLEAPKLEETRPIMKTIEVSDKTVDKDVQG